jgi:hypothetical protein
MHSLAQPGRISLQRAGSSSEPAWGEDPRSPRGSRAAETPALSRTEIFMATIALHLRKGAKYAPARRCRMIAAETAGTAVLPLAVPLAVCGPCPETQRPVRGSGITRPRARG